MALFTLPKFIRLKSQCVPGDAWVRQPGEVRVISCSGKDEAFVTVPPSPNDGGYYRAGNLKRVLCAESLAALEPDFFCCPLERRVLSCEDTLMMFDTSLIKYAVTIRIRADPSVA